MAAKVRVSTVPVVVVVMVVVVCRLTLLSWHVTDENKAKKKRRIPQ